MGQAANHLVTPAVLWFPACRCFVAEPGVGTMCTAPRVQAALAWGRRKTGRVLAAATAGFKCSEQISRRFSYMDGEDDGVTKL